MKLRRVLSLAILAGSLLTPAHAQQRNEIAVPNIDGYTTLKCDFHIHSVFSDGLVWPTVRVNEAYREGLDAISLTEHIEYRPHKQDIVADHNRSYEIIKRSAAQRGLILIKGSEITRPMAPGHSNALFLTDSNPLEKETFREAYAEAKKQNAFIFWNHPGWDSQQPDSTKWWPEHTELYNNGCMNGIEVANGDSYFPEAVDWCLEKNLTMLGTSDVHRPIQDDYDFAKGEHRTMTFIFAKDRSEEGIREAMNAGRTAVWYRDQVIGKEELLRAFFEKCIEIKEVRRDEKGVSYSVTNLSDIPLQLIKTEHDPSLVYFRNYTLNPHTPQNIRVKFANGVTGGKLNFQVDNFVIGAGKKLQYSITL